MTLHQIINLVSYPVEIVIEDEQFSEVFHAEQDLMSNFKGYNIQQIKVNPANQITVYLVKRPSLEELGYSFESGV